MSIPLERTLVVIKPDAVARGLIGEITARFERAGLTIIAAKLMRPGVEFARSHYPSHDQQLEQMGNKSLDTYKALGLDPVERIGTSDAKKIGQMIHHWNAEFLASGPVFAMVLQGAHAVQKVRRLCGKTIPLYADPGTIRGDFASTSPAIANLESASVFNLIHASDNETDPQEPETEIRYWFSEEEIYEHVPVAMRAMFKSYYPK
jgi:nucleoside-diphosphate kinase